MLVYYRRPASQTPFKLYHFHLSGRTVSLAADMSGLEFPGGPSPSLSHHSQRPHRLGMGWALVRAFGQKTNE